MLLRRSLALLAMKVFRSGSEADLYGRWNALAAEDEEGQILGSVPAHDGDFFPESPLDHIEVLRSARSRGEDDRLPGAWPVRVDIDVTQVCNSTCVFCYSREYFLTPAYRGQVVCPARMRQLLKELAERGTITVRYTGGGEPLIHPDIHELLRLPHQFGLKSCVITNGDRLDSRVADIVYDHVDHLRWSVNAATDRTRRRLHRPHEVSSSLRQTMRIVEHILNRRARERAGVRKPMVWATFLLLPDNISEALSAARRLRDIGVDSVSFRPSYHGLGACWTDLGQTGVQEILEQLKELHTPPEFSVFTPKRPLTEASQLVPRGFFKHCLSCRTRTVLESVRGGLALKCCGMYRGSEPLSSLIVRSDNDFETAWAHSLTHGHARNPPTDCPLCIDVSMNVTLNYVWSTLAGCPSARFLRANMDL